MVQEKTFREDLYYRLNVVRIQLPPLRERFEDVPLLVDFVLKRLALDSKVGSKTISPEAMTALSKYTWPGNVRELENLIYRSAVMAQSDTILIKDLPEELLSTVATVDDPVSAPPIGNTPSNISERPHSDGSTDVSDADAPAADAGLSMPFGEPFSEVYKQLREAFGTNILEHAEREIIKRTLEDVGGKQVKAAEILGMTRATLRKRIDQYDLGK
jgi:two-component system nitrogen regulation response regulator GlnG